MADVFSEVDEELRRDRTTEWVKAFWPYALGVALLIVVGVAGREIWLSRAEARAQAASAAYIDALDALAADQPGQADLRFETLAETGPEGYAMLARMRQAALAAAQGETERALGLFEDAVAIGADERLADLARLQAAYAAFGTESRAALETRLSTLLTPANPFRHLARELVGLAAWTEGDAARARSEYGLLNVALDATPALRQRAAQALAVLGPSAAVPADGDSEVNLAPAAVENAAPGAGSAKDQE
ncbi:MAG: tetratricopeptide repeat protein [Maricaulaceae bacterium]